MAYASSTPESRILGLNMWQQVIFSLIFGVAAGLLMGEKAEQFKIFGVIFLKMIKMVIPPLIFFALINGLTSISDGKQLKGMVTKGVAAYVGTAIIAVVTGLFLGYIFAPGEGFPPPAADAAKAPPSAPPALKDFLMGLIPGNIVHMMSDDMYLQIVIYAVFTGVVINNIKESAPTVHKACSEGAKISFKMIEWIVSLAPIAVFGFISSMVGTTGVDVLKGLAKLTSLVIFACSLQYVKFIVMIIFFGRISPFPFMNKMIKTQIMAFSTSSSKATLKTAMEELENRMGVSKATSNFMMPLGACVNMDGTAIYLGICAMFFAQMYGVHLGLTEYLTLTFTCTLGSVGAAGVPSGSIIFMGMVLNSVGIPLDGIAVILGVDRILDMFRTTVNITGDAAVTLIVDSMEEKLDLDQYYGKHV